MPDQQKSATPRAEYPQPLPRVWVGPVRPETYPGFAARSAKPVTRSDLGSRVQTGGVRGFACDPSPTTPPHRFRITGFREALDLWTRTYEFGSVVWPMWQFLFAENWREVIDELARRKLYLFDIWGYCPSGPMDRFEWSEYRVPAETHEYLLHKLGPLFLGYDNGEQDGRYIGGYAKLVCPAPATRQQGYAAFCDYFRQLGNDLQHYLIALCSLTYPHYFAALGNHRMLGAETAQALPSVPMWYAFVRGAGKQYGLLWFGNASIWNRWGVRSLADPMAPDTRAPGYWTGPTSGTSVSLLRRLWYVLAMYGSSIMTFEAGQFANARTHISVHGMQVEAPELTDIGREQLKGTRWLADHPDGGELHTPIALLWDFYAGWAPPRHLYTADLFLVWGNMPYTKGDHQIDLMLRELYPGYPDAGFYHDERGFLTPTPCGDSFDILLSDAPEDVLQRYQCIVLLGDTRLEGGLLKKLARFVKQGGSLVAFANQLAPEAGTLFGVEVGPAQQNHDAVIPGLSSAVSEAPYQFRKLTPFPGTNMAAHAWRGEPLAVTHRFGKGETLLFAADFGLTDPLSPADKIESAADSPLLSPYALLEHVKAVLLPRLRSFTLITVEGPPVQYLVNVTRQANRLVVTLCNNSPEPWEGSVRPKRGRIREGANWMTGERIPAGEIARVSVKPLDVVTLELLLDQPTFVPAGL